MAPRLRVRLKCVQLRDQGQTVPQIAEQLQVSQATVRRSLGRVVAGGLDALADRPRSGRPPRLSSPDLDAVQALLWYALEMLEASREGLETHTRQGWNIGRPPYGYLAERVEHPVPAKRREGKTKARLVLDPIRAPVVAQVFTWRTHQRLGYHAIAKRLNQDPDRYPPPDTTIPGAARGHWTDSAVADVITNPKYTGYMVWNRRAHGKSTGTRRRPPDQWIWSPEPTHPAIITLEQYAQAAQIAAYTKAPATAPTPTVIPAPRAPTCSAPTSGARTAAGVCAAAPSSAAGSTTAAPPSKPILSGSCAASPITLRAFTSARTTFWTASSTSSPSGSSTLTGASASPANSRPSPTAPPATWSVNAARSRDPSRI
jgi:hypothetical protein